ncbi:MAG: alpha-amylase family glycosyl hydrolase [Anaeromyxobacter sp.]
MKTSMRSGALAACCGLLAVLCLACGTEPGADPQGANDVQSGEPDQAIDGLLPADGAGFGSALSSRTDPREESIYFVMTTRFFDGDTSNNARTSGDDQAGNPASDPSWRGDFKGLIQKLDYIKALGFTAIWITPVVQNKSGYDFHGYHAYDFNVVDPRLLSSGVTFQTLINEVHARNMKLYLDIVLNHSSSWGAKGLQESSVADFNTRTAGLFATSSFHDDWLKNWEDYTCQIGSIAGDCLDLNTEDTTVQNHLISAYGKFIDMGVDGFRIDTVKHVSRVMFNRRFVPAFRARAGSNFFMFGEVATRVHEVWNKGVAPLSTPFYTWAERTTYSASDATAAQQGYDYEVGQGTGSQPTSSNHYLSGNAYHAPDHTKWSDMSVIDFPLHWNFQNAGSAWGMRGADQYYNDATYNVTYVDSHDYGPDMDTRYNGGATAWAENWDLMFTWRGIPVVYYGSEVEFQAGMPCDKGPTAPLSTTGRAYFGDRVAGSVTVSDFGAWSNASGAMATTLSTPLAKHLTRLNQLRRAIPALQKGQYSTDGVSGNIAFKKRYTSGTVDSMALVTISGNATFSGIPNGTYVDAITGAVATVTGGTLATSGVSGQGNMRIYVLNGPGKIGADTQWLVGTAGPTPPDAPTSVSATAASSSQINLSWAASAGATSYTVYRSSSSAGTFTSLGSTTGTSYSNTGLAASSTWFYYVVATNSAGSSGPSPEVSATTLPSGGGGGTVTTTIRIHYDTGFGNSMYVRGSVAPLSWTVGLGATWTTGNVWVWTTTAIPSGTAFEYKALINDGSWSDGANYAGTGGQTLDITPTFSGNFYDTMDTISTNWTPSGGTTTGKWVQGTLNGSGVAQCVNCSTEAVLTLKPALNKTGTTVTLAFKYSTTALTSTEYLKVDVLKGTTWTTVGTYTGTIGATNKSINITAYGSTALKVRFRAKMSGSSKKVTVDNVTVSVRK